MSTLPPTILLQQAIDALQKRRGELQKESRSHVDVLARIQQELGLIDVRLEQYNQIVDHARLALPHQHKEKS